MSYSHDFSENLVLSLMVQKSLSSSNTSFFEEESEITQLPLSIENREEKKADAYYLDYYMAGVGLIIIFLCAILGFINNKSNLVYNIFLLIGALSLLLGASDVVLEYAVKVSEGLGVSELVIGLTIVSLGTSIPEMFTAIASAKLGIGAFIVGDVIGSYITQLSIFLGIVVLFDPKTANRKYIPHVLRDGILVILALLFLSYNLHDGKLLRYEAIIGISLYIVYLSYLYRDAKKNPEVAIKDMEFGENLAELERIFTRDQLAQKMIKKIPHQVEVTTLEKEIAVSLEKTIKPNKRKIGLYIFLILVGTFACYIGATYVVFAGSNIAYLNNVPEHIVAATIIGFGTGFPEFVVSVMAIRKKKLEIAYGNLIGSNIVDPLVSISLGILTQELFLSTSAVNHILTSLVPLAIILDLYIIILFRRKDSTKKQGLFIGIGLVCFYFVFLAVNFMTG